MVKEKRGRKPIAPERKKIAVQIYLEQQTINYYGGIELTKQKLLRYANRKIKPENLQLETK